jgi:DNA-binding NtrC family response regulator
MRVLLATGDDPKEGRMQRTLEGTGHEVIRATARGDELLASIEQAGLLHAAVVSQGSLGRRWPKLLRQLRKRASHLPVILLLGPKAERAWRLAMLAGAFDVVSPGTPEAVTVHAVHRALAYTLGRVVGELSMEDAVGGERGRSFTPGLAQDIAATTTSR